MLLPLPAAFLLPGYQTVFALTPQDCHPEFDVRILSQAILGRFALRCKIPALELRQRYLYLPPTTLIFLLRRPKNGSTYSIPAIKEGQIHAEPLKPLTGGTYAHQGAFPTF